ncbi:XRE family transcriptional regulator [Streptomyces sp. AGS-58]|uniref:nSTAND1 domain-containing NTPase n=1 Tax=unclassified Streptomyces TaxID=2593676 RepID=UPI0035A31DF5
MARKERPLEGEDGPLLRFAAALRRLRHEAGSPPYRDLAHRAHYSVATLSGAASGRRLPSLDVTLSYVRACGGDPREWEGRWHAVAVELRAVSSAGASGERNGPDEGGDPHRQPCPEVPAGPLPRGPYVGLAAFRTEDADLFFGRERLVEDLLATLARRRAVAVVGASGAGKSSLLRAGLLPRLTRDEPRRRVWVLTPGPHPWERLEKALAAGREARESWESGSGHGLESGSVSGPGHGAASGPDSGPGHGAASGPDSGLGSRFLSGPGHGPGSGPGSGLQSGRGHRADCGLGSGPGPAPGSRPGELVVVVDQFEEVFTVCTDADERARFIAALVEEAERPGSGCRIVLGVRADFYAHCTRHAPLVAILRDAQVVVGPMSAAELRCAVVEPARRAGLTVEGALQATLVAHAHGQAGVLPLLSHALLETWRRRRGAALTLDAFHAAGGFEGALAQSAESLYSSLTVRQRQLARQTFVHLIALGEGTEDTKRPVSRDELGEDADTATVLARAAALRLLTLDDGRVELTHEALIRAWPRLRGWLTDDRERLRAHRRLTDAARAWETLGRDPGALYRGARLALARDLVNSRGIRLAPTEQAFVDAGTAAEAAADDSARRRARRLRFLVALLAVLVVVAAIATVDARRAEDEVTRQRNAAVARTIADSATGLVDTDPGLAVQLGLTAYRLAPTARTRDALVSTLMTTVVAHAKEVLAIAYRPDGRQLATASGDHTARLWRVHGTDRPVAEATLRGHGDDVRTVAYRPDGRALATGSADGSVRLWDTATPTRPALLASLTGQGGDVRSVAYGPDGRTLATAGSDGSVGLWDVTDPARPALLTRVTGHRDAVRSVAFSPDGGTLASAGEDGAVRLTAVADRRRPRRLAVLYGHATGAFSVAFSPDGRTLATAGGGHAPVRLWNLADPRRPAPLAGLSGHTDVVGSVAFSPDGRTLASASDDRTVRLWSVDRPTHPTAPTTLTGHGTAVSSVAFSPDGTVLASGGFDATVRLAGTDRARVIAHACAHTGPRITRAQWAAHLPYVAYAPPCGDPDDSEPTGRPRRAPGAAGGPGRPAGRGTAS